MKKSIYITRSAGFLPNKAIENDEMEEYLGLVNGAKSRSRQIILRSNGIKKRYYAIDKDGNSTHSNQQLAVESIRKLFDNSEEINNIELLSCGTTSPELLLPAHGNMVHGELCKKRMEVHTSAGSCNSGMSALKYAFMSIMSGNTKNAVVSASEKLSPWLMSKSFEEEKPKINALENRPIVAFEREFLRWMLSDGSAALLLEDSPKAGSIRIDWIEFFSYSGELETCMYAGGIKDKKTKEVTPWRELLQSGNCPNEIFSLAQDVRLLDKNIVEKGAEGLKYACEKHNITTDEINYFLPHISSMYFKQKIIDVMASIGCPLPEEKWFINLPYVGNLGSVSALIMIEEIMNSGKLKKGDRLLVMVPESARFSYAYCHLTVI